MKTFNKVLTVSILAITAVTGANAVIVSETMLSKTAGVYDKDNTVQMAIADAKLAGTNAATAAATAQSAAEAAASAASAAQTTADGALKTVTANNTANGIVTNVATSGTAITMTKALIKDANIATDAAISTSKISGLDTALAGKAAKATTLSGYGITDAYTKSAVDTAVGAKQDTLVASGTGQNIKGTGSVTVSKDASTGMITISGTDNDTKYTLPNATTSVKGGVIVGSNIGVSNGTISVADATPTVKGVMTKAEEYDADLTDEEKKATAASMYAAEKAAQIAAGTVNTTLTNNYQLKSSSNVTTAGTYIVTGNNVASNLAKLDTAAKNAKDAADAAASAASAAQTTANGALKTVTANNTANGIVTNVATSGTAITMTKALIKDANIATDAAISTSKISGLDTALAGKAAKATTLSGYGITDAYTKSAVDTAVGAKQDTLVASGTGQNIKGTGSVTVSKDASTGMITISGTDNNTTYSTGTASTAGLTKLYTATGSATDGTMTQKSITDGLATKQNALPAIPATPSTAGVYVLTAKVENSATSYYWEDIGR